VRDESLVAESPVIALHVEQSIGSARSYGLATRDTPGDDPAGT
jgi:hypothetical protein